jgi:hypothetical protein
MDRSHLDLLQDESVGHIYDFSAGSDVVLVAFGALNQQPTIPVFEFFSLLQDVDVDKIFVRDLDQLFYHGGVRGLGSSIPSVARELRELLGDHGRVVFVGGSAGGYAAVLFGTLLGADEVVVASPQTFLGHVLRRFYRDGRWPDRIAAIHALPQVQRRYLDLRRVFRRSATRPHCRVFFAEGNTLDVVHVRRLQDFPEVDLHPKPGRSHNVFREMRDNGNLKPLLVETVGGDPMSRPQSTAPGDGPSPC